jgi:hypothetical protein
MDDLTRKLLPYGSSWRYERWRATLTPRQQKILRWPFGRSIVIRQEMKRLGRDGFRKAYFGEDIEALEMVRKIDG